MAKSVETVLYYNPGTPETMKHVAKMKSVLVRMGVRIRNIRPEQTGQTVGFLAGLEGFEELPRPEDLPVIPEEVLVLKQFSNQRLDELLLNLRKAGVPRIAIKAVLTQKNAAWPFYQLYRELREEHEIMHGLKKEEGAADGGAGKEEGAADGGAKREATAEGAAE